MRPTTSNSHQGNRSKNQVGSTTMIPITMVMKVKLCSHRVCKRKTDGAVPHPRRTSVAEVVLTLITIWMRMIFRSHQEWLPIRNKVEDSATQTGRQLNRWTATMMTICGLAQGVITDKTRPIRWPWKPYRIIYKVHQCRKWWPITSKVASALVMQNISIKVTMPEEE